MRNIYPGKESKVWYLGKDGLRSRECCLVDFVEMIWTGFRVVERSNDLSNYCERADYVRTVDDGKLIVLKRDVRGTAIGMLLQQANSLAKGSGAIQQSTVALCTFPKHVA